MTPIEGKIALGLDEFMLRLGHIKLFCRVAREFRGPSIVIQREMAAILGREVVIPRGYLAPVARYLREKRLCRVRQADNDANVPPGNTVRYPDLWLTESSDEIYFNQSALTEPKIWQQDLWLADPLVRSRVGAIPLTRGKGSSKSGLSHVSDWCSILDVATASGELTAEGHLLGSVSDSSNPLRNPYVIGVERIALAFLVCEADFDLFSRMAEILATAHQPIDKQAGIEYFRTSVQNLATQAESERGVSVGLYRRITQLAREVGVASLDGQCGRDKTASTAWHRASSRFETYVDLGLLDKGRFNEKERYQYRYYSTDSLSRAVASLTKAASADAWIATELVSIFSGSGLPKASVEPDEILPLVPALAAVMRRPPSLLPIRPLALGVAMLFAEKGRLVSLGDIRRAIEDLAVRSPERARLSRGSSGEHAEFISIETKGVENGCSDSKLFR